MNNFQFIVSANPDGSVTIPSIAARGLGILPGETLKLTSPLVTDPCDCPDSGLFIGRCCMDEECSCYRSDDPALNIPAKLLAEAKVPLCSDGTVFVCDGALVIVVQDEPRDYLAAEVRDLLEDVDLPPHTVYDSPGMDEDEFYN